MAIKPRLTTFDTVMLTVSLVIGIGIFRTPAMAASVTKVPLLFFSAWGLGCLISLTGALTFAEVGSRFPEPGSYYKVLASCYRSELAFMFNWTNALVVNAASSAGVAMIGAEYMCPFVLPVSWQGKLATQLATAGLVLVLMVINYCGIKAGARTQDVLSVIKIVMIVILVLAAFLYRGGHPRMEAVQLPFRSAIPALWLGFVSVFYSFGGYQNTINFGADVKNARKRMPRGIFFGMLIVGALYLLINFAYYRVLGISGIASAKLVAGEVARIIFGPAGHFIISLAIFLSAMGFMNATLMHIPRVLYAMAADGVLPPVFRKVNARTQVQGFALLFFGVLVLISIFFGGTFEKIVSYVIFQDSLNIAAVASTIFFLRRRQQGDGGKNFFCMPFYPVLPFLFVLFLVSLSLNVLRTDFRTGRIGLAVFLAGLPLYYLMKLFGWKGDKD